jgi:DNA-binding XRE family transcriptional regulator
MDLTAWMAKHDVTDQSVADAIGVTRPYIYRIRKGEVSPSLEIGLKLWEHTKRKVDIYQLLPKRLRPALKQPAAPERTRGRPQKLPAPKASRTRAAA